MEFYKRRLISKAIFDIDVLVNDIFVETDSIDWDYIKVQNKCKTIRRIADSIIKQAPSLRKEISNINKECDIICSATNGAEYNYDGVRNACEEIASITDIIDAAISRSRYLGDCGW